MKPAARASQVIGIARASDAVVARRVSRSLAEEIGFEAQAQAEIGLAVSELAANLVQHAGRGSLVLTRLTDGDRSGLQIEALDQGPGIADPEQALTDGYSTAGGLGYGLGAVNRMMDEFTIRSEPGCGTQVRCRRWLPGRPVAAGREALDIGVASRPHPGIEVNGDAFLVERWEQIVLVGAIDGLGHGPFAHRAAQTARQFLARHCQSALPELFRGTGYACRATRGAVMALARIDWGAGKLSCAGIGNVEVRLFPKPETGRFVGRRGIIGGRMPSLLVCELPWGPGQVLVLHTDGIRASWEWEDYPGLAGQPAAVIAQELLQALARGTDDATVVVVQGKTG